jgi:hypothetical protein
LVNASIYGAKYLHNVVGHKKRKGIMKFKEGKSPFNLFGYITISKHFMSMKPDSRKKTWFEGMFADLFTKLSVNTIGRSDNIDDLILKNMDWENDALTIRFCTTKTDQAGETTSEVKRLFANPFKPEVCVILSLAVYTWCKRRGIYGLCIIHYKNKINTVLGTDDANLLFDGEQQNKRYYNILIQAMSEIPSNIDLGCARAEIGTHSNRKFAESTSVSKIDGPSRTQVCLRAGQGVGRTQDCYMFSEEDGDSLVGRTVAQLKMDADEFDILPCHFSEETLKYVEDYGWRNVLDGYENYKDSFKRIIKYLLPCLIYHYFNGDLARLYATGHPIFSQRIFTDSRFINTLRDKVILVHAYCRSTHMNATGVPGIITISREIRNFRKHYDETCSRYDHELQKLGIDIQQLFNDLPSVIIEKIHQNFVGLGERAITAESLTSIINEILNSPSGQYATISNALKSFEATQNIILERLDGHSGVVTTSATATDISTPSGTLHTWSDDDILHMVPQGFRFPSYNLNTMMNLWFLGDRSRGICAFKQIIPKFDLKFLIDKCNRSRTKKVIKKMLDIAVNGGIISTVAQVNESNLQRIYDYAYPILIELLYPGSEVTRAHDINVNTLANRLKTNAT